MASPAEITLPQDLLPADGRFGAGPSKVPVPSLLRSRPRSGSSSPAIWSLPPSRRRSARHPGGDELTLTGSCQDRNRLAGIRGDLRCAARSTGLQCLHLSPNLLHRCQLDWLDSLVLGSHPIFTVLVRLNR